MTATLYQPGQPPQFLSAKAFHLPAPNGRVPLTQAVAEALGCPLDMVEILARGTSYVAYAVFASNGIPNQEALAPLFTITGMVYGYDQDEPVPRGNVLVVCG